MREFTEKVGRWARGALKALRNPLFFLAVRICDKVQGPLEHFLYSLKKKCLDNDIKELALM